MSNFNYQKKIEHEQAAEAALKKNDLSAALYHTTQAANYAFSLALRCSGKLSQAYLNNGNGLLDFAEELKAKIKQQPDQLSVSRDTAFDPDSKIKVIERPKVRLSDVAGMEDVKNQIRLRMLEPLKRPEEAKKHGLKIGGGILLYGPPGTGKTFIAKAVAGELDLPFFSITSADVFGKFVGESENNIRNIFATARKHPLSVIFIDELETIFRKRNSEIHETTQKVISVLLQELDGVDSENSNPILLLGATNTPWMIDEAFLRTNRLDVRAFVGLPDYEARKVIIVNTLKSVDYPVEPDAIEYLAKETEGFSGADITGIIMDAKQTAFDNQLTRYTKELFMDARSRAIPSCNADISQKIEEWEERLGIVRKKKIIKSENQPAPKQEQADPPVQKPVPKPAPTAPVPPPAPKPTPAPVPPPAPKPAPKQTPKDSDRITLSDVKGLTEAKEIVYDSLINPVLYPDVYKTLGVIPGTGLLLYGPPGTGKTMFGRAIANELNTEFLCVTLSEIKGKTSLHTVQMISDLFTKARSCPNGCVLCLDDCEEILSRPGSSKAYGVSQFLNELDGLKKKSGSGRVFVLIATNRPWMIDGALLRSGRISASVYVGLPDEETRKDIIESALNDVLLSDDVDLEKLAAITEGYSCAELYHGQKGGGICNLARIHASRRWVERIKQDPAQKSIIEPIFWKDFMDAMSEVTPAAVRDADRIRQIDKFRETVSLRRDTVCNQDIDEEETVQEEIPQEAAEERPVEITVPDVEVLKNLVFQSKTIQNTPDYKHCADSIHFLYNEDFADCDQFNAYATTVCGIMEKYDLHDPELQEKANAPAIVMHKGLNLVNMAVAAYYQKINPTLSLENPEGMRDFLGDLNEILVENESNFTMENLAELNQKYNLFPSQEELKATETLCYAMTVFPLAHELGHIIYGDIFKVRTESSYERNMERSADQFATEVINGIESPELQEVLALGAALSFIADTALGAVDQEIAVDSEISHPATLERFRNLLEHAKVSLENYNLTEENFLRCIP